MSRFSGEGLDLETPEGVPVTDADLYAREHDVPAAPDDAALSPAERAELLELAAKVERATAMIARHATTWRVRPVGKKGDSPGIEPSPGAARAALRLLRWTLRELEQGVSDPAVVEVVGERQALVLTRAVMSLATGTAVRELLDEDADVVRRMLGVEDPNLLRHLDRADIDKLVKASKQLRTGQAVSRWLEPVHEVAVRIGAVDGELDSMERSYRRWKKRGDL